MAVNVRLVPSNAVLARVMVVKTGVGGGGGASIYSTVTVFDVTAPEVAVYITVTVVDLLAVKVCVPSPLLVAATEESSSPLIVTVPVVKGASN